jgi:Domain of unknown function (DUF4157)
MHQRKHAPQVGTGLNMESEGGTFAQGPDHANLMLLQAAADQSLQVQQFRKVQDAADQSPQVQQMRKVQDAASAGPVQPQGKGNQTGMPDELKSGIESLSGMAMDDVKVHYNSDKPAQLQAHAFAQGSDIHIAPGQEKHLPHEAWHVVQQKQGRVQATTQLKGVGINDDSGLEHEADVMGAKAMQSQPGAATAQLMVAGGHAHGCGCNGCSGTAQRVAVVQRAKLTKADVQEWQEVICTEIESGNYSKPQISKWEKLYEMVDTDAQANDVQTSYNDLMGHSTHPSNFAYGNGMLFSQYFNVRKSFFPGGYDSTAEAHRDNFVKSVTDKSNSNLWTCPCCNNVCRKNIYGEDVTIDHITDCATYWNNAGRDESKQDRINFYNDTSNHEILCRSCNSSKSSGGITYRRMVGPNFTH